MSVTNQKWILKERPNGLVKKSNFDLIEEEITDIKNGEILVKNSYLSFDPTQRMWLTDLPGYLPPVQIDEVVRAGGVGEVIESKNDDYNEIMVKVLADRLAEAAAEWLHRKVRTKYWGYSKKEELDLNDMLYEKYVGIRPAPGYPACPDHKEKDKIWKLLQVKNEIGISLTESRAMFPAASVCGWYFSHPKARYFSVLKNNRLE